MQLLQPILLVIGIIKSRGKPHTQKYHFKDFAVPCEVYLSEVCEKQERI